MFIFTKLALAKASKRRLIWGNSQMNSAAKRNFLVRNKRLRKKCLQINMDWVHFEKDGFNRNLGEGVFEPK
jgi:hypothetical protein